MTKEYFKLNIQNNYYNTSTGKKYLDLDFDEVFSPQENIDNLECNIEDLKDELEGYKDMINSVADIVC